MKHSEPKEMAERAALALADGTVFWGRPYGARGKVTGEVVFCTSMTGYQEILTDPSYHSQIVVMTAPQIGNVGVNPEDAESRKAWAAGFIMKDPSPIPSSYRARKPLSSYLEEEGVVSLAGVDTRALTRHIRDKGAQMAVLQNVGEIDPEALIQEAREAEPIERRDLVLEVTTPAPYDWTEESHPLCPRPEKRAGSRGQEAKGEEKESGENKEKEEGAQPLVVVYDFGVKFQMLRLLRDRGLKVRVVPATTSAEEVLALRPAGVLLSNGPGDPARCSYAIEAVKKLVEEKVPIFGICLGHQILALALGARTRKMPFGHRGANQPVSSGKRVMITSQNHGFEVVPEGLDKRVRVWETNLSDGSVEGIVSESLPVFSVQYHPEASPGPHDAMPFFARFLAAVEAGR